MTADEHEFWYQNTAVKIVTSCANMLTALHPATKLKNFQQNPLEERLCLDYFEVGSYDHDM